MKQIEGEPSYTCHRDTKWEILWKLKIHGLIKHFIWRACHNILPMRINLFKRKISYQTLCPICELGEEMLIYTIWDCSTANYVWEEESSSVRK